MPTPPKTLPDVWYHGDAQKNRDFSVHTYDRNISSQAANAAGPGIYFTSDREDASRYGHLYSARMKPGFRIVPYLPAKRFKDVLKAIYDSADEDSKEVFLSNWGEGATFDEVFPQYSKNTVVDTILDFNIDLFRNNSDAYVAAMRKHFDGFVLRAYGQFHTLKDAPKGTDKTFHLVVFNPDALDIREES